MAIYPAILTDSLKTFEKQLIISQNLPTVDTVQIDIIDGFFADNLTVTPLDLVAFDFANLKCDLHLMVDEPLDFVLEAVTVKNLLPIKSIIAQIEHMSSQQAFIEEVKANKWRVGLSLDIDTPLESIDRQSFFGLDIIQLMGIRSGFQGQSLDERIYQKIVLLKSKLKKLDRKIEIIIDGGVKKENAAKLVKTGASSLAVGSLLWSAADPAGAIGELSQR